jgi:hypothetical protein
MLGPYGPTQTILGHSTLLQYVTVSESTFTHNRGDGLMIAADDYGLQTVVEQVVTISGSTFDYNHREGLHLEAIQVYGAGAYGDAIQSVTISNSDFSGNHRNGLYALAGAYEEQGRAEQYITVINSTFNDNRRNGIYLNRVAEHGTYVSGFPCYTVQNPGGGCAFVRQTFYMNGGSASYNNMNGLYVRNTAFDGGAIYATTADRKVIEAATGYAGGNLTPTVLIRNAQFNVNGQDGLYSRTNAYGGSYVFNFIAAVDTIFNYNGRDGFHVNTYAGGGSVILERNGLYSYKTGTTANGNGRNGVFIYDNAVSESNIYSLNVAIGITANGNTMDGISITAANHFFANGEGYVKQANYLYGNTTSNNHKDGVSLYAYGPGVGNFALYGRSGPGFFYAQHAYLSAHHKTGVIYGDLGYGFQYSILAGNMIASNARYGLYAYATVGATQVVNVRTGGNAVISNTVNNYYFNGSPTQYVSSVSPPPSTSGFGSPRPAQTSSGALPDSALR